MILTKKKIIQSFSNPSMSYDDAYEMIRKFASYNDTVNTLADVDDPALFKRSYEEGYARGGWMRVALIFEAAILKRTHEARRVIY